MSRLRMSKLLVVMVMVTPCLQQLAIPRDGGGHGGGHGGGGHGGGGHGGGGHGGGGGYGGGGGHGGGGGYGGGGHGGGGHGGGGGYGKGGGHKGGGYHVPAPTCHPQTITKYRTIYKDKKAEVVNNVEVRNPKPHVKKVVETRYTTIRYPVFITQVIKPLLTQVETKVRPMFFTKTINRYTTVKFTVTGIAQVTVTTVKYEKEYITRCMKKGYGHRRDDGAHGPEVRGAIDPDTPIEQTYKTREPPPPVGTTYDDKYPLGPRGSPVEEDLGPTSSKGYGGGAARRPSSGFRNPFSPFRPGPSRPFGPPGPRPFSSNEPLKPRRAPLSSSLPEPSDDFYQPHPPLTRPRPILIG